MNTSTAPDAHTPQAPSDDLDQALATTAEIITEMTPNTTSTHDARAALAVTHQVALHLEHWQNLIATRRDELVLHLWGSGQPQAEIAAFLDVPKSTRNVVRSLLRMSRRRTLSVPLRSLSRRRSWRSGTSLPRRNQPCRRAFASGA